MKRALVAAGFAVIVAIATALTLTLTGTGERASRPQPFHYGTFTQIHQQPVEQQSSNFFFNNCGGDPQNPVCDPSQWVYNPTVRGDPYETPAVPYQGHACDWDVDDSTDVAGSGSLAGGSSVSGSLCLFSEPNTICCGPGHQPGFAELLIASSPNLLVTVTSDHGLDLAATPTVDTTQKGKAWDYLICSLGQDFASYPVVDGSNGGVGIPVVYTVTVQNPTGHAVTPDYAIFQSGATGSFTNPC